MVGALMEKRTRLKTYSHLAEQRRIPSEYEIVTTRLLYHPRRGFEVRTPGGDWFARHQAASALQCADWEAFRDPRETTYTSYTALQSARESFVDGILRSIEEQAYDGTLPGAWKKELAPLLSALRFPFHGLQMVAAYAGSLAPSGRIAIAFLLQSADEMRKIQRLAYRIAQLEPSAPGAAAAGRSLWQDGPELQPLRKLVEELLVTYDWSEAWVALNLAVKPVLDDALTVGLAARARAAGDPLLAEILGSLREDALWQREWTRSLVSLLEADRPGNGAFIRDCSAAWLGRAREAVAPLRLEGARA
jgi:toluene monooxygenase system protein E